MIARFVRDRYPISGLDSLEEGRSPEEAIDRQRMEVDIVCVGFGPAMGGFLTTLSRKIVKEDGSPLVK